MKNYNKTVYQAKMEHYYPDVPESIKKDPKKKKKKPQIKSKSQNKIQRQIRKVITNN